MSYAKPYAGIPYLSNARSTIALEQIVRRAEEKGSDDVAAEASMALEEQAHWRTVTTTWIGQNRSKARQGGQTFEVDAEADYVISGIYSNLDKLARHPVDSPARAEARRVVRDHFTDARGRASVGVMSQVIYEEQLPRMRAFLAEFAADPDLARRMRIADWVAELAEIEPRYAASLEASERVTWGEVVARRNTAYDGLFAVVGLIFARHRRVPATLAYLLAPLDDQVARAAELARRRRAGQSVPINEDELSPEELNALEGADDDLDGDGLPDGPLDGPEGAVDGPAVEAEAEQPQPQQPQARPRQPVQLQPEADEGAPADRPGLQPLPGDDR